MNKKTIFSSIIVIAAGILLSGAISYAEIPSSVPSLINVSNTAQSKTGSLNIGPLVVNGVSQFRNHVNILGLNPNAPTGVPTAPTPPSPPGGGGGPATFLDKFNLNKAIAAENEICGNGIDDNNNGQVDEGCSGNGYFQVEVIGYQVTHPDNTVTTYCDPASQNCVSGFYQGIGTGDKVTLKWSVTPIGSITLGYCTRSLNTLSAVDNTKPLPPSGWNGNVSTSGGTKDVAPVTVGVMHQFVMQCYDSAGVWGGLGYVNIWVKNEADLIVPGRLGVGTTSPTVALDVAGNIRILNTFTPTSSPNVCATTTGHLLSC